MCSDNRASLSFELYALHRCSLEGFVLERLLIEGDERLLEQIVRVRLEVLKVLSIISRRRETWLHSLSIDRSLVLHEVVILVLLHLHGVCVCLLGTFESLAANLRLQGGAGVGELFTRLACHFESAWVQVLLNSLVVGARQKVDPIDLSV